MEFLKNWIMGICGSTVLISLICALIPKTSTARLIRVCGAVILVFAVFTPLKTVRPEEILSEFSRDFTVSTDAVIEENERFEISIIENKLREYILQRAKQLGLECEVKVRAGKGENGMILPKTVELYGNGELDEFVRVIEIECGVKTIVVN